MSQQIIRNESFDLAFQFVCETNTNLFLTGKAGTGKTTFLKYVREHCSKQMVVAAPTGVAAINAGGVTLHSLFQLPFGPYIPTSNTDEFGSPANSLLSQIHFQKKKLNLFRSLDLLIIDEASMVPGYTVDAIDAILRAVRRRPGSPFGGVQVLFIGDLHQLPPVIKAHEWELLRPHYPSPFFFDSLVLREQLPVMIELTKIYRQQDDSFIRILNEIRNNQLSNASLELLQHRLKPAFKPEEEPGCIMLTTHNAQAEEINSRILNSLPAKEIRFDAEVTDDFPPSSYPADEQLKLKVGAQVMFLKSDNENRRYFNGKIGTVTELADDLIRVVCEGEDPIDVKRFEWKNIRYDVNKNTGEIKEEELGKFLQYPLRLAWAITIHKSQGLTFQKLAVDAGRAFARGQVYVALSRCTSLEGLFLTSPFNRQHLGAHQDLLEWKSKNVSEPELPEKLKQARFDYAANQLLDAFNFRQWQIITRTLGKELRSDLTGLDDKAMPWFKEMEDKQSELFRVSTAFSRQLKELLATNESIETNTKLQDRLREASAYFQKEIKEWLSGLSKHPLTTDVKKTALRLDPVLENLNEHVREVLKGIVLLRDGFFLLKYLEGRRGEAEPVRIRSAFFQENETSYTPDDDVREELYRTLSAFRFEIASETGKPLYNIFTNNAMRNVCMALPRTHRELQKVGGFGPVKVKQYGDDVLSMVESFCEKTGLTSIPIPKRTTTKKGKPIKERGDSIRATVNLLKAGNSPADTASIRKLALSTIEGHAARAIGEGLLSIGDMMPEVEALEILSRFPADWENMSVSALRDSLGGELSYARLQMVIAWQRFEGKLSAS